MSTHTTPVASPVENIAPPAPKKRGRKPKDPNAEPKPKKTTTKKSTTKKSTKIIEKTSGEEPAEKTSGEEPAVKTSGEEPAEKTSDEEPAEKTSDEEPAVKTSDEEPAVKTSDEEPAIKTSDEEPAVKTSDEEPSEKTSGEEPSVKPTKSKPLSAKHAKFIHFSFFLLEHLNHQGLNIDTDLFYNAAHIFDTPDNQTSFVDNFINSSKTTANRIKLLLKSKSKPKPKPKPKSNNDIVNHLVDLAQNNRLEHELLVSEFIHKNTQYLIDNDHNVYHFTNHLCIGKLHNNNIILH